MSASASTRNAFWCTLYSVGPFQLPVRVSDDRPAVSTRRYLDVLVSVHVNLDRFPPVFLTNDSVDVTVREDAPVGSTLIELTAVDRDLKVIGCERCTLLRSVFDKHMTPPTVWCNFG